MVKMVIGALVGVIIIVLGIYVWYVYMTTFLEEGKHILFALSIIQIGIGIYILFWASHSNDQKIVATEIGVSSQTEQKFGTMIERNNQMMVEYNATADMKDKMSLIKNAAKEEEKKRAEAVAGG